MDIYLDRRAVRQIRLSAQEAVEQVEEIERRLDSADFFEFLTDVLDEWSGDDVEELFELLDTQLSEIGIDLKFDGKEGEEEEDEEEEEEDLDDDFLV
jgi:hypothetical protein